VPPVENPEVICAALTERGLSGHLCAGAINWLSDDLHAALSHVKQRVHADGYWIYIIAYFLSLVPFLFFRPNQINKIHYLMFIILGIFCFAPLFVIAIDWGRWISFYITSITIIVLVDMSVQGRIWQISLGDRTIVSIIAILHITLWSFSHFGGRFGLGLVEFVVRAGNEAARLLS
jgi:hypothetical protein